MLFRSKSSYFRIKHFRIHNKRIVKPFSSLLTARKPSISRNAAKLENVHFNSEIYQQLQQTHLTTLQKSSSITPNLMNTLPKEEMVVNTIFPKLESDFVLENGHSLAKEGLQIKYATFGKPEIGKPILLLCPSMSSSVFAMDFGSERGWWRGVVGKGSNFGIDVNNFFVVVGAPLGAPFGSTSPLTLNPVTNKPYKSEFPQITPGDQAKFQNVLLESLGIEKVQTVLGGSMGGMQTLQFIAQFPDKYDSFVSIAATSQTTPDIVALRSVQREIVKLNRSEESLRVARMMGTIFYRSRKEFKERFNWRPNERNQFEVEEYLKHQGEKFSYDIDSWLLNSKSMDLQNVDLENRVGKEKKGLLLSYSTDRLTPSSDHKRVKQLLEREGVETFFDVLESDFGHDAFLIEREAKDLNIRLKTFLNGSTENAVNRLNYLFSDVHYP